MNRARIRPCLTLLAGVALSLPPLAALAPQGALGAAPPAPALAWERALTGRIHLAAPAIVDLNGDGEPEVVVGDLEGWLHVIRSDGSGELPGWPQRARVDGVHATAIESAPAIADLDGDGKLEVIVGATSTWVRNQQGGLVVFDRAGHLRWRWQGIDYSHIWDGNTWTHDGYSEGAGATPAVGDVNGDGHPDIVFGAFETKIHALDRYGREISGFPYQADDAVWSSAALYDIDHDGRMEIFVGSGSTGGGPFPHMGGTMFALDWRNGTVATLWRRNIAESLDASPAIGDINGDGKADVVVTTSYAFLNRDSRSIFAWNAATGAALTGWPVDTGSVTSASPALGDVNGDGDADVVVGSWDGRVRAYNGGGHRLWTSDPFGPWPTLRVKIEGSAAIADLNGDGRQDVVAVANDAAFVVDGRTGAANHTLLGRGYAYHAAPAVGQFHDGYRLVLAGFKGGFPTAEGDATAVGRLFLYDLPAPGAPAAWPMWRRNASRLGAPPSGGHPYPPWQCAPNTNPALHSTLAGGGGYRIVRRNGALSNFGTATAIGDLPSRHIAASIVAARGTPSGRGTWFVSASGRVYAVGDAHNYGSIAPHSLTSPIGAMAVTPSGRGYWLAAWDGGVFGFGDAHFYGSAFRKTRVAVAAIAATPSGNGYRLLALDGGVFGFGDAHFYGSPYGHLGSPTRTISATSTGKGYWLQTQSGAVYRYGDATYYGAIWHLGLCSVPTAGDFAPSFDNHGYFSLTSKGQVYAFGSATRFGAIVAASTNPAVAVIPVP